MQKRYDETLTARLELVEDTGCAYVAWDELYRWYEVRKIAARTYRDLQQRWDEIEPKEKERKKGRLMCVARHDGVFLFSETDVHALGSEANDKQLEAA
jgi:hypothetical protein